MTVLVEIRGRTIVDGAPIIRKFFGQTAQNLVDWMKRQGGFKWKELK